MFLNVFHIYRERERETHITGLIKKRYEKFVIFCFAKVCDNVAANALHTHITMIICFSNVALPVSQQ